MSDSKDIHKITGEEHVLIRYTPILVIIGCIGILQFHSIEFWTARAGSNIGWAWSIVIEIVGLWMWALQTANTQRRPIQRRIGWLASTILLAGVLLQLGLASYAERSIVDNAKAVISDRYKKKAELAGLSGARFDEELRIYKKSIEQNKKVIETYRENSMNRKGWLIPLQQLQTKNDKLEQDYIKTVGRKADAEREAALSLTHNDMGSDVLRYLKDGENEDPVALYKSHYSTNAYVYYFYIGLQMVALILLQVANILAVQTLARRYYESQGVVYKDELIMDEPDIEPVTETVDTVDEPEIKTETRVKVTSLLDPDLVNLQSRLREFLDASPEHTVAQVGRSSKVIPRNINYLLAYDSVDKRKPSVSSVESLKAYLDEVNGNKTSSDKSMENNDTEKTLSDGDLFLSDGGDKATDMP